MNCPKCETKTLVAANIRGTQVDRCPACGGIWFDHRELGALLEESASSLRPLRGGREQDELNIKRGVCPRDGSRLMRVCSAEQPDVVVDSCPQCQGIWLDGGELDKLIR